MAIQPQVVVSDLARQAAARHGLDLVDVSVRGSGPRTRVRVLVDRKGGVDVETCRAVSAALSRSLDEADPLPDRYVLEVSSPGIDHPLETRRDFERVEGREVVVHYRPQDDERVLQARGKVVAASDEVVRLTLAGESARIPYDRIVKATQALPW